MAEGNFRYIAKKRRPKEDRRFIAGAGRFVADVNFPGMLHVGLVASPYPFARIRSIDTTAALALPGVHAVVTSAEIVAGTDPILPGVDAPKVKRWPLAHEYARYSGEWVAAVVAESRALAEDAAELVEVDYEPLTPVTDPEQALDPASPVVHPDHGSNLLFRKKWVWGTVDADFAAADHTLSFRARWHRSSTVPIETFGVVAQWDYAQQMLDVWASIQMPKFSDQLAKALRLA
ncbi:MAG TPA: molybdopterin cofactor-binding domain-containing protein, partial [Stellaceae bacterium]|nr:molybdopterin cofactor-binding domain-containing protein [Stellaceae bacterium]